MRCNWRIPSRRSDSKESGQYIHEVPSSMLQDIKSQHTANMCPTKIIYQSNSLPCFNWTILGHYWPRWRFHLASHTCGCWWAGGLMITHRVYTTLRPRRNEQHFADDIFKRIFFNENGWISIKISLKFVRKGPINNIPALVQIMAWRRSGDKPLSEPMIVILPTHICVTRPQWDTLYCPLTQPRGRH